ncbi:MAG: UDP-2,3-diacylglucosamine diphosphatase [Oligoflexia bacterium]|nr:UDP-2,3-diacylglucosamine diphosphatase [Oligoflexia bacterium]
MHLTKMASPQGEAILALIRQAQTQADLFVILGDLFDMWLGSGESLQKEFSPLIESLGQLSQQCPVYYFEGNHDIHLTDFWQNHVGLQVSPGPRWIEYHGLVLRCEHGDEINREDRGYLFLRWLLRTPIMTWLISILPSWFVNGIGIGASKKSRDYTSSLENRSKEILRQYSHRLFKARGYDFLIVGHTHTPDVCEVGEGTKKGIYINLGSWFEGPRYLAINSLGQWGVVKLGQHPDPVK